MMRFLAFGEILWDVIEGKAYLGGAPFNVAAHMAKCGAESYILSCLGNDDLGKKAFDEARQLSVHTSLVQWDEDHPTGTVEVYLKQGQPDYTIHEKVAWDFIQVDPIKTELEATGFDCFYFGTLAQRNEVSRQALQWILHNKKFDTVFYDVNVRKGILCRELIEPSLKFCDVFKLNVDEVGVIADLLFGKKYTISDFAEKITSEYSVKILVMTASERGCYVYASPVPVMYQVAGKKVEVVDAVGAGDAFSAAFLFHYFKDKDPVKAAEVANQLGGFVASSRGAIPAYSPEIKEILKI